jgi:small-conductance mechanosensitive channel
MGQSWHQVVSHWQVLVAPTAVLLAVLACGWLIRRTLFHALKRWASRSESQIDDIVVKALHGSFMLWVAMLGLHLATQSSELPERLTALLDKALLILWIISLTAVAARLVGSLVTLYNGRVAGTLPVTTLTQSLARAAVAAIGILILLDTLHISITPILTALGVGGIAVALALQDTLSNLFAGFYVSLAGQVRPGDYIKLDGGEEGYVADINWRSTSLRALPNNLIVVPNAKLAQAIVTNFHLPEKRMSLLLPVSVSYDADPDDVERILIEEALAGAPEIPGLLSEPAPFVRFIPGFGASSLDFTLICQVGEFVDQYLVQHELRKRVFKRLRREGIEIPFPIRTLYIKDDAHDRSSQRPSSRRSRRVAGNE